MGYVTTAIMIGSSLLKADAAARQGEANARAQVESANIQAQNRAKEVRLAGARAKVGFINSGFVFNGLANDTATNTLNNLFASGQRNIQGINRLGQAQAKNSLQAARNQVFESLDPLASKGFEGIKQSQTFQDASGAFKREVINPIDFEIQSVLNPNQMGPFPTTF